jgi:hypothetical protein
MNHKNQDEKDWLDDRLAKSHVEYSGNEDHRLELRERMLHAFDQGQSKRSHSMEWSTPTRNRSIRLFAAIAACVVIASSIGIWTSLEARKTIEVRGQVIQDAQYVNAIEMMNRCQDLASPEIYFQGIAICAPHR